MARSHVRDADHASAGAVLITGASSGIGRALALDLATRGVTVLAGVRNAGDAPRSEGLPGQVREILLDVTDASQVSDAAERISEHCAGAPLRALVNNAGGAVAGPMEYVPIAEMRRQFEVNVFGQLAVTQSVLELIRAHGDGRIVFMNSIAGRVAAPCAGPYAASKHALNGMADALRRELRPSKIQVSSIAPGAVATPIWEKTASSMQRLEDRLPPRGMDLYGGALKGMRSYVELAMSGRAIPLSAVVRAARHALYARRARATYVIGAEARVGVALSTALPTRTFDTMLAQLDALLAKRVD